MSLKGEKGESLYESIIEDLNTIKENISTLQMNNHNLNQYDIMNLSEFLEKLKICKHQSELLKTYLLNKSNKI